MSSSAKGGAVVLVSSAVASHGSPATVAYAATKGALEQADDQVRGGEQVNDPEAEEQRQALEHVLEIEPAYDTVRRALEKLGEEKPAREKLLPPHQWQPSSDNTRGTNTVVGQSTVLTPRTSTT